MTRAASPLVLHVLPVDAFRGAQTYARALCDRLDGPGARHESLVLFRSPPGALRPEHRLDVPPGLARRAGFDPRTALRLRAFLRQETPALVVAHGGEPLKYLCAVRSRGPLVYYKIGIGDARLTGIRRWLHRRCARAADVVAAVSEGAAGEARALGVPADRVVVIPNGRDAAAYPPRSLSGPDRAPKLLSVGHFDAAKRPERFIRMVRALRSADVAVEAAMAGDGPLLEPLRDEARSAGVELLGNRDDVPALLAASDLFVFTGGPPEGMPGVLIEAGLAGLAVVTTAVPGAEEVVESGHTGAIVPVDDFYALVREVRALVEDPERRDRWGDAARRRCAARFGLDSSVDEWRALLARLLAEPCASST
jgi:glycosyltransferase involved in cell wall biosynthesis